MINDNTATPNSPTLDDELPIKIEVSTELAEYLPNVFTRFQGACNKLSAQLNFQTMLANWYNNEDNLLTLNIHLLPPEAYQHHLILSKEENTIASEFTDDVFLQKKTSQTQFIIFIAITEKEQQLLNTHVSLCRNLTEKKLVKVINLFADYLSLNQINH